MLVLRILPLVFPAFDNAKYSHDCHKYKQCNDTSILYMKIPYRHLNKHELVRRLTVMSQYISKQNSIVDLEKATISAFKGHLLWGSAR